MLLKILHYLGLSKKNTQKNTKTTAIKILLIHSALHHTRPQQGIFVCRNTNTHRWDSSGSCSEYYPNTEQDGLCLKSFHSLNTQDVVEKTTLLLGAASVTPQICHMKSPLLCHVSLHCRKLQYRTACYHSLWIISKLLILHNHEAVWQQGGKSIRLWFCWDSQEDWLHCISHPGNWIQPASCAHRLCRRPLLRSLLKDLLTQADNSLGSEPPDEPLLAAAAELQPRGPGCWAPTSQQ